jgi:hypothetical protein
MRYCHINHGDTEGTEKDLPNEISVFSVSLWFR